ncbi:MAG: hypothetical protein N3F62_04185, partial [Bacteroidia bacterium]|nr:hypothetical protein [Bacteroidia bacterium]
YYNATNINDFKTLDDAVGAFFHANAGWGKSLEAIKADVTGGLARAKEISIKLMDLVKKNPKKISVLTIALILILLFVFLILKK